MPTLWQSSVRRGWIEVHAHFVAVLCEAARRGWREVHAHFVAVLCEARAVGSLGAVV